MIAETSYIFSDNSNFVPSKSDTILYIALILSIMLLAYVIYTKLYPTAGAPELIKTATAPSTVTLTLTKTVTTTSAFTSKPGTINVNFEATILGSTISLSLTNYDNRPYRFVKFELVDAQSKTVVYFLEIDVNLLKESYADFDVSIPKGVLQQGRTYIITLYTDDGFRVATTAGA
jgi:hypothetical protein